MSASYAPPDETSTDLWQERSSLNGSVLAGVSYGIHFTLFLIAVPLLIKRQATKKREWGLLLYTTAMFILGSVFIGANTKVNELSFIDNRNFPGGPNAYLAAEYNSSANTMGNAVFVVANWLADGLLIYRCLLIYNFHYWIILLPAPMYLGSVAMGIMVLFEIGLPASNLWTRLSIRFTLAYFSLSLSLNVILTLLIVIRLLIYRHRTRKYLGANHANHYTSIVAMLVESSALYSAFSLLFIISYARNSFVQNLFLPVLGEVQMISPLLIVIRVALGRGWSKNTAGTIVTGADVHFHPPSASSTATSSGNNYTQSRVGTVAVGLGETAISNPSTSEFLKHDVEKQVAL